MTTLRTLAGSSRLAFRSALSLAAFAVLTPATARAMTASQTPPQKAVVTSRSKLPVIDVENNNWLDVHVYALRDGEPFSLGVVSGPGKSRLVLPAVAVTPGADLQILVQPIGSPEEYVSPVLTVNRGDVVDLTVENSLPLSSVSLAPGP